MSLHDIKIQEIIIKKIYSFCQVILNGVKTACVGVRGNSITLQIQLYFYSSHSKDLQSPT